MKKTILLIMTFIWIGFIFYNSLQSGIDSASASGRVTSFVYNILNSININIPLSTLSKVIRKLAHIFEYFILGLLIALNIFYMKIIPRNKYVYTIALSSLIAVIDEIIQTMVPGRHGSIIDVLIDLIGIVIALLLVFIFNIKRYRLK